MHSGGAATRRKEAHKARPGVGAVQRLEQYKSTRAELQGIEDSCFICDVQQWPSNGASTPGRFFPCQLTHGTVVSFNKARVALGLEHLVVQGFHVLPGLSADDKFMSPLAAIVGLSGKCMNLPSFTGWVA